MSTSFNFYFIEVIKRKLFKYYLCFIIIKIFIFNLIIYKWNINKLNQSKSSPWSQTLFLRSKLYPFPSHPKATTYLPDFIAFTLQTTFFGGPRETIYLKSKQKVFLKLLPKSIILSSSSNKTAWIPLIYYGSLKFSILLQISS